ncbi:MAG: hypothetical protein ABI440_09995 [Casimicrobiaceae bacterium]
MALPIVVLLAIYHGVVDAWWMADDSMHLLSVARYGAIAHFVQPLEALQLSPSNLTPWLYASYAIDFALGGLDPHIAYAHHLVSWSLALVALTFALRRLLPQTATAGVLVAFILAVPTSTVVLLLCTRQYIEGLFAATLCVIAYDRHRRHGRRIDMLLSSACYAWAMSAKEIYVPLGPLLILHHAIFDDHASALVPMRTTLREWISRLWLACRALWPYVLLAGAYVVYRGYMLGFSRLLAGYDNQPQWHTRPAMLLDLPAAWEWACGWKRWQSIAWLLLVLAGTALWLARVERGRRDRIVVFCTATVIAIFAPLYPVLGVVVAYHLNTYYLMLPLLAFFALAGWASMQCVMALTAHTAVRLRSSFALHSARIALSALLVALMTGQFISARHSAWPWSWDVAIAQYRVEGAFELYADDHALILDAIGPTWHHYGLQHLRERVLHKPPGPQACVQGECDAAAARQREHGGSCVRYDAAFGRLDAAACVPSAAHASR